jgi:hypothetical protein
MMGPCLAPIGKAGRIEAALTFRSKVSTGAGSRKHLDKRCSIITCQGQRHPIQTSCIYYPNISFVAVNKKECFNMKTFIHLYASAVRHEIAQQFPLKYARALTCCYPFPSIFFCRFIYKGSTGVYRLADKREGWARTLHQPRPY